MALSIELDSTDWAILRELQDDARMSFAEIGRRVSLSSPAVKERISKLEDAGVIAGYRVDINLDAIGY
ncbi:MAG: AsnC family transcriptional regulator, partial [Chloroflexota bacterium]